MKYSHQQYKAMQAASGLEVGDKVKVLRPVPDEDLGWLNGWVSIMDDAIGGTYTISSMDEGGVRFKEIGMGYPFQALELVSKKADVFEPFTITLDNLEEFEMMKAIMSLHHKVSNSSFFDLEWTPDSVETKLFMKRTATAIQTHRKGWSKYNKGE